MNGSRWRHPIQALATGLLLGALPAGATHGPLLDDVEAITANGRPGARLAFTLPMRHVRHFPSSRGEVLTVHLEATYLHGPEAAHEEYRHAPHAPALPEFTVTLNNKPGCHTGPNPVCLIIQFRMPVQYTVRPGSDGRSLLLEFPQAEAPSGATPPAAP